MSVDDIVDFLRSREVPEPALKLIRDQKVDFETVKGTDDQTLSQFVPRLGDRIALKTFCSKKNVNIGNVTSKRSQLFDLLKSKITKMDENTFQDSTPSTSSSWRQRQRKCTRKVEFGWIHQNRQVRKRYGGGCRKIDVDRRATKAELFEVAKNMFFPNGISTKGPSEDFGFDLLDFKEGHLTDDVTVADCYDIFKTGIVTFYLHTFDKQNEKKQDLLTEPDLPTNSGPPECAVTEPSNSVETTSPAAQTKKPTDTPTHLLDYFDAIGGIVDDDLTLPDLTNDGVLGNEAETEPVGQGMYCVLEMRIHRNSMAFFEMLGYFKDPSILEKNIYVTRISQNGEVEKAEDTGGVLKDALSDFWQHFYSHFTLGRNVKVPCLRHDFGIEEWSAVGRILLFGWKRQGYWPIHISEVFFIQCLFPDENIATEILMNDFHQFISTVDRDIFSKATADFSSVDNDDLLEALEANGCKVRVQSDNIVSVLLEIAHKELIQTPMFVSDCWRNAVQGIRITRDRLSSIYKSLTVTNKSVVQMLSFPSESCPQETEVGRYMKRYVKELDKKTLQAFLRFCTGSDILNTETISVMFVHMDLFSRRPIAHTCGAVLQLGNHFDSYMDFRAEFDNVLSSNIWVMDIV